MKKIMASESTNHKIIHYLLTKKQHIFANYNRSAENITPCRIFLPRRVLRPLFRRYTSNTAPVLAEVTNFAYLAKYPLLTFGSGFTYPAFLCSISSSVSATDSFLPGISI